MTVTPWPSSSPSCWNRNPDYEVRWFAPDGMERVRIDRQGQHLWRVTDDQLQTALLLNAKGDPSDVGGGEFRRGVSPAGFECIA